MSRRGVRLLLLAFPAFRCSPPTPMAGPIQEQNEQDNKHDEEHVLQLFELVPDFLFAFAELLLEPTD